MGGRCRRDLSHLHVYQNKSVVLVGSVSQHTVYIGKAELSYRDRNLVDRANAVSAWLRQAWQYEQQ